MKGNNKEISAYLHDKQIECFTFNIIQHYPATKNNDSDKDVLLYSGRNKSNVCSLARPLNLSEQG